MAQLRLGDPQRRARRAELPPKLLIRSNQKLIAGYPSDSPVSTTDEEWEAEELSRLKSHSKFTADSNESSGLEEWSGRPGLAQHQIPLGGSASRGSKRHWAPGEGVIDQHLFLLDDRPWQEFYTLFFTPMYIVGGICLVLMLTLLLLDGTVMCNQQLVFLAPAAVLSVGLLANFLFACLFPVPGGASAPAYDNWTDPLNQQ